MNDPDLWEPDNYDAVVLEWSEEAYLLECGTLHSEERMSQDDHGDVLALVVIDVEDWVQECIDLATGEADYPPRQVV